MSKELKTLKDLKYYFTESGDIYFLEEELKQEAIKWVKRKGHYGLCLQDWEDFFNITEEDLKTKDVRRK